MWEEIGQALLQAIQTADAQQCRAAARSAAVQLGQWQADARYRNVSEITQQIAQVDHVLFRAELEIKRMGLSPQAAQELLLSVTTELQERRRQLVQRKRDWSLSAAGGPSR